MFFTGENMNKAIVALEILRTVAIKKDRKEIEMSLIWFYCLSIVVYCWLTLYSNYGGTFQQMITYTS